MMTIEVNKTALEKGLICTACREPVPASVLWRVTCPTCKQVYVATPAPDPAP